MIYFYNGTLKASVIEPGEVSAAQRKPPEALLRMCLLAMHQTTLAGWLPAGEIGKLASLSPYLTAIVLQRGYDGGMVEIGAGPTARYYRLSAHGVDWIRKMVLDAQQTCLMFERHAPVAPAPPVPLSLSKLTVQLLNFAPWHFAGSATIGMLGTLNASWVSEDTNRYETIVTTLQQSDYAKELFQERRLGAPRAYYSTAVIPMDKVCRWLCYHCWWGEVPAPQHTHTNFGFWPMWSRLLPETVMDARPGNYPPSPLG